MRQTASLKLENLNFLSKERWLSGRKQRFAKPPYRVNWYRGFESPPLRPPTPERFGGQAFF